MKRAPRCPLLVRHLKYIEVFIQILHIYLLLFHHIIYHSYLENFNAQLTQSVQRNKKHMPRSILAHGCSDSKLISAFYYSCTYRCTITS